MSGRVHSSNMVKDGLSVVRLGVRIIRCRDAETQTSTPIGQGSHTSLCTCVGPFDLPSVYPVNASKRAYGVMVRVSGHGRAAAQGNVKKQHLARLEASSMFCTIRVYSPKGVEVGLRNP